MVASYLVHHSYCATAEAFAKSTDQAVHEELASIKNRQKIQKLVLSGRMGEAIETTQQLYPNLLERNPDLLFMLKVRQFIEMVNGTDSEVRCLGGRSPKSQDSYPGSPRTFSSPSHKASSSQPYLTGMLLLDSRSSELIEISLGKETNPLELHQLQKYLMFGLSTKIFQLIFSTSCLSVFMLLKGLTATAVTV
ncbi:Ran-binding protein 9 [Xenoophorus captivus]|uniref:Ran-binding protein 9 n=1 Tax=Xenoophorus captivus TaxID=1517983 RepID=A0ABV0QGF3_9TELE